MKKATPLDHDGSTHFNRLWAKLAQPFLITAMKLGKKRVAPYSQPVITTTFSTAPTRPIIGKRKRSTRN